MNDFLQRIASVANRRRLLPVGRKILVAVSGGVDSMVLLHALHQLAPQNHWKLSVAHFNHQLRGKASDADEKLVCSMAKKLSLPIFCERGDVAGFARRSKISVEMAARKLRHEFLAGVAKREKISIVALAHHADDQVELFFLRLLRGAGGEGLAGMKWRSPSPVDKAILLVRPLIDFPKPELLDFACKNKVRFREDATNSSSDFLRNRIRNELLPLLRKKYQPGLDKAVLRMMDIVGAESEFVGQTAGRWLERPADGFDELPVSVQRRVLQQQVNQRGIHLDFDLVEQLRTAAGKFVSVGASIALARTADGKLLCREQGDQEFKAGELAFELSGRAGRAKLAGTEFHWSLKKFNGTRRRPIRRTEFFDADKIGAEIILRHWRAGDRFQPIGMKSAVKLQDLFVNAKAPAAQRRRLVLAATATGEIFWVEGLRIGEKFKLTGRTRRQLVWEWSKKPV